MSHLHQQFPVWAADAMTSSGLCTYFRHSLVVAAVPHTCFRWDPRYRSGGIRSCLVEQFVAGFQQKVGRQHTVVAAAVVHLVVADAVVVVAVAAAAAAVVVAVALVVVVVVVAVVHG